ncbi:inositol polyphosphate 5-phosphatase OCRL-like [Petromyzon marinus]|uniref:inositol polyphosphate 5-phosphatase OCRL-like n=1 Tax=Petromyzon marinus TaxID=7757 RepID=UPI003F6FAFE9
MELVKATLSGAARCLAATKASKLGGQVSHVCALVCSGDKHALFVYSLNHTLPGSKALRLEWLMPVDGSFSLSAEETGPRANRANTMKVSCSSGGEELVLEMPPNLDTETFLTETVKAIAARKQDSCASPVDGFLWAAPYRQKMACGAVAEADLLGLGCPPPPPPAPSRVASSAAAPLIIADNLMDLESLESVWSARRDATAKPADAPSLGGLSSVPASALRPWGQDADLLGLGSTLAEPHAGTHCGFDDNFADMLSASIGRGPGPGSLDNGAAGGGGGGAVASAPPRHRPVSSDPPPLTFDEDAFGTGPPPDPVARSAGTAEAPRPTSRKLPPPRPPKPLAAAAAAGEGGERRPPPRPPPPVPARPLPRGVGQITRQDSDGPAGPMSPLTTLRTLGPERMSVQREALIQEYMRRRAREFTTKCTLRFFIGTWNVNGQSPYNSTLKSWLSCDEEAPDVYYIGFQELDLSKEAFLFSDSPREKEWVQAVVSGLHCGASYKRVTLVRLVGMMLLVYAKAALCPHIQQVVTDTVGTGIMGRMGNKGGVGVSLMLHGTSVCVVNSHLAAHTDGCERRNEDFRDVCARMSFQRDDPARTLLGVSNHDALIWLGDLNYRINNLRADEVKHLINNCDYKKLQANDQLTQQQQKKAVFVDFRESELSFPPTYKYDPGTDNWDTSEKGRAPAWCDRVLWRGDGVVPRAYRSHPCLRTSDHKPVSAALDVTVNVIDQLRYGSVHDEVIRQLDRLENEFLPSVLLSCVEFSFPAVKFRQLRTETLLIRNDGQVPCTFEFVPKLNDTNYCKPWLSVKPNKGFIMKGEQVAVAIEVYVNQEMASLLGGGQGRCLDDILVLHLQDGRDHFLIITGSYTESCFGASLSTLCHSTQPLALVNTHDVGEQSSAQDIPKEMWILVNHLYRNALTQEDLFQQPGLTAEMEEIRDCLDTDIPDTLPGSNHSVAESLLMFLEALAEPVVSCELYGQCLDKAGSASQSSQVIQQLPRCHLNTFRYLMAFLRELLKHSEDNGVEPKLLATVFGGLLLRPPGKRRALSCLEKQKAADFIFNFLLEASSAD